MRFNGIVYEALSAAIQARTRFDIYHCAPFGRRDCVLNTPYSDLVRARCQASGPRAHSCRVVAPGTQCIQHGGRGGFAEVPVPDPADLPRNA